MNCVVYNVYGGEDTKEFARSGITPSLCETGLKKIDFRYSRLGVLSKEF